jgi:glycosyltransferase involved in cell wall biosynthesis
MRLLHIIGSIDPAAGGPTEVVRMLIEHQPPGYTAEVVTTDNPAAPFLKTFPFKIKAFGGVTRRFLQPALTSWLRANRDRFDGVMLHGLWEYTGIATLHAIAGHKPYVVFPHGMLDPYFKRRFPAKHAKKWAYWLLNDYWLLRRADRALFTTQTEAGLAKQSFFLHDWRAQVMPLGAEPPPANIASMTPAFFARVPEVREQPFLLFLGRLHPKKAPDLLLRAFAALNEPALHLVMAGPCEAAYLAELQALVSDPAIAERIHWPGMIRGEAKWAALAACEAFVLPSHQENFGIAVVEALACGRPVLLSSQINIAAECEADGCALVAPDTFHGTLDLLGRWTALSTTARTALSQQARSTFDARYDMRLNAPAILRVFETL